LAAYAFTRARYPAERIVLWGESLGTGVAVALAAQQPVGHLILQSPFTSAADVGAQRYWFVPVGLLMKDQFRSDLRIGKVTAPVLVLHGDREQYRADGVGGAALWLDQRAQTLRALPGIGHNDLGAEAVEAAKAVPRRALTTRGHDPARGRMGIFARSRWKLVWHRIGRAGHFARGRGGCGLLATPERIRA